MERFIAVVLTISFVATASASGAAAPAGPVVLTVAGNVANANRPAARHRRERPAVAGLRPAGGPACHGGGGEHVAVGVVLHPLRVGRCTGMGEGELRKSVNIERFRAPRHAD